ncbi:MAG: glycosyltransferase, partial [Planctomycetota bacterium]
ARHRPGDPLVVGWCGSTTHDEDLGVVREAIEYLLRKHKGELEFHFFGYVPDQLAGMEGVYLVRGTTGDLAQYARGVRGSNLHIAIAPLMDHPFNHCKSDLKYLEYSLCCVPGVYSNITPYAGSVRDGVTGLLVENETGAWVEAIERLIDSPDLREEIAKNAYDEVRATACVDVRATEWDDLYRSFVVTGPQRAGSASDDKAIQEASSLLFLFQARQQARAGEMAGSVVSLEASLSLDPSRGRDVIAAGCLFMNRQEYGVAEHIFHAVVRETPDNPEGYLWLARFYRALGDVLRAEKILAAAAELHPADPDLVSEHVEHLIDLERPDQIGPRLSALVKAEHHPEEAVMVAEMMVRMGRAREARAVIEKAGRAFPKVDFSLLQTALARAERDGLVNATGSSAAADGVKIAVYTREPLTSPRVTQRLRSPFRALERAALATTRWSDGELEGDAVDWADVVVLHRDFAKRDLGERIVERARKRGMPVVFELDDLPYEWMALNGDQQAVSLRDDVSWMIGAADVTTVATEGLRAVLSELNPSACERIVVLETAIDPGIWESSRPWRNRVGKPFQVGLVTDWCRPAEIRRLVSALSPLLGSKAGEIVLSTWSPRTQPGAIAPMSQNIGSATPFYVEYAQKLQRRGLDIALVPVSNDLYYTTLPDSIAVELAAAQIPAIFSSREPFASSVVQGRTGILLGDEPDAWAAMVQRLMQCDRTRRDLANRAWNIAFAERTVQPQAATWGELYGSLVEGRRVGQLSGTSA